MIPSYQYLRGLILGPSHASTVSMPVAAWTRKLGLGAFWLSRPSGPKLAGGPCLPGSTARSLAEDPVIGGSAKGPEHGKLTLRALGHLGQERKAALQAHQWRGAIARKCGMGNSSHVLAALFCCSRVSWH